jgi:hypothetical protein
MTPQRWDGGSARPDPPGAFLLWPAIYVVTAASLLLGLYSTSLPGWDFALGLVAFALCVTIAGFWAFSFCTTASRSPGRMPNRVLLRWIGIPLAGVITIGLAFFNVPGTLRFDLSRQALENAAATRLHSGPMYGQGWVGLMPIDEIRLDADGTVIFVVNSNGMFGGCGYAYNPKASPAEDGAGLVDHIAPGWWTWCEPWMD